MRLEWQRDTHDEFGHFQSRKKRSMLRFTRIIRIANPQLEMDLIHPGIILDWIEVGQYSQGTLWT